MVVGGRDGVRRRRRRPAPAAGRDRAGVVRARRGRGRRPGTGRGRGQPGRPAATSRWTGCSTRRSAPPAVRTGAPASPPPAGRSRPPPGRRGGRGPARPPAAAGRRRRRSPATVVSRGVALGARVTVCNRTRRHADRFAAAGATVVDLAELPAVLATADVAFLATAAPHPLVDAELLRGLPAGRGAPADAGRPGPAAQRAPVRTGAAGGAADRPGRPARGRGAGAGRRGRRGRGGHRHRAAPLPALGGRAAASARRCGGCATTPRRSPGRRLPGPTSRRRSGRPWSGRCCGPCTGSPTRPPARCWPRPRPVTARWSSGSPACTRRRPGQRPTMRTQQLGLGDPLLGRAALDPHRPQVGAGEQPADQRRVHPADELAV